MPRGLGGFLVVAFGLVAQPGWALIGDVPAIRRVALCPSDQARPRGDAVAMLAEEADGSFVLIVRSFDRETGAQRGESLVAAIPPGTFPVELSYSTAFDPRAVLVLDRTLRIHSYAVAFDADGTPKLVGETPTIRGPFGDPAVLGAGTALAEVPGATPNGPAHLAIGTARGRLIIVPEDAPAASSVLGISPGPIEDLAGAPQVGYFAFLAVTGGRLHGVNPDADAHAPGAQPSLTFSCIPQAGWLLRHISAPYIEQQNLLPEPAPVRIAAANGSPAVAVLEIPARPTFGSRLRIRALDTRSARIAHVALGFMEEEGYLEQEPMLLLDALGAGVSFDPAFSLANGFTAAEWTLVGATTRLVGVPASSLVTAFVEVENGFATQIDPSTLVLTAGASSVAPSPHQVQLTDTDSDGNTELAVTFERAEVLRMLLHERTLDVVAAWTYGDASEGRATARVRLAFD